MLSFLILAALFVPVNSVLKDPFKDYIYRKLKQESAAYLFAISKYNNLSLTRHF
jgi:hypothetical protein